ncbi:hypothetical protein E6C27_scaffold243G005450 [Cucumis melo var. makuwa]|uniref:Ty3-gypsy retrotransposon protein n=1 Tax=Cucumis melo var. makuwa TaxID=1194695 RepID=A0A5A7TXM7_CUCMM|nr:hypothetical protein E6C27_scaffold243G005450 [Cucumis melo var. makuwa]
MSPSSFEARDVSISVQSPPSSPYHFMHHRRSPTASIDRYKRSSFSSSSLHRAIFVAYQHLLLRLRHKLSVVHLPSRHAPPDPPPPPPDSLLLLLPSPDRRPNPLRLLSQRTTVSILPSPSRASFHLPSPAADLDHLSHSFSFNASQQPHVSRSPTPDGFGRKWPSSLHRTKPELPFSFLRTSPGLNHHHTPIFSFSILAPLPLSSPCVFAYAQSSSSVLLHLVVRCVEAEPRTAEAVFFHSVRGVTLEFRSFTVSAVGANSPLLGHRCPDVLCIVVMLMGYVVNWNSMSMDYENLNVILLVDALGLELRRSSVRWFSIDCGVTVSFIHGVAYLTGMVSFGIPRLICASFGITRLICVSFGITRLICKSLARGKPARRKKDA